MGRGGGGNVEWKVKIITPKDQDLLKRLMSA